MLSEKEYNQRILTFEKLEDTSSNFWLLVVIKKMKRYEALHVWKIMMKKCEDNYKYVQDF